MTIYWRQKDIPQLKGLSPAERYEAKRQVLRLVWAHWQVWLPFVGQVIAFLIVLNVMPEFPYRIIVLLAFVLVTSQIAALPFNHYLHLHLSELRSKGKRSPKISRL